MDRGWDDFQLLHLAIPSNVTHTPVLTVYFTRQESKVYWVQREATDVVLATGTSTDHEARLQEYLQTTVSAQSSFHSYYGVEIEDYLDQQDQAWVNS